MTFTHHDGAVYLNTRRVSDEEAKSLLAIFESDIRSAETNRARGPSMVAAGELIRARVAASRGRAI